MTVSTPVQPDFTAQNSAAYKANIDGGFAALWRGGTAFAPHEQASPNMTVRLDAGVIWDGVTLTEVAAQSTGTVTAPVSNPRIDLVVVDQVTGAVSVVTGTEDPSPTQPAPGAGKMPVCAVALAISTTAITNSLITDRRVPGLPALVGQSEAETGTATTPRLWSAERVAQSIAVLATPIDQVARDMAASALAYALASNDAASITGVVGSFALVDDFETDSLATKTNATYDVANDWYSNQSSTNALTGGTATASSADGASVAANAADGNTGTFWQAGSNQESTGWWSYDLGPGNDAAFDTWRQYWDGSASGIETADIKASATGAFAGEEVTVASGVDFNLNAGAGWYEATFTAPGTAYRYWRIYSASTVNSSNANRPKVFEFEARTSFLGDMVLRPSPATIAADPDDVVGYFVYDPVDSVTLGTDLLVKYSIDGGSTWATAGLTALGALGASGLLMFRAEADVSAQSGTSLVYSVETANSKEMRYVAHVGTVPLY